MDRLNIENVSANFAALAHLTSEEAETYLPTVKSAVAYFGRLFLRDPTEDETPLAEYACGCKAFFDYTILCAATPRTFSSQSGSIFAKVSEDEAVNNAEKLMRSAMAALPEGLLRDDGFIFEGTEG